MRITRVTFLTLSVAIILASCKTTVTTIPVPAGSVEAIAAVGKKAPLTEEEKKAWNHADLATDSIPGMSTQQAYDFLKGKQGTQVVVAVVDSGTDLEHEDLKDVAWVNPGEIANNGKDDDKNGFVDDVNGWNFLGDIYKENAELYRIVKDSTIADAETYKRAKKDYDKKVSEAATNKQRYGQILQAVTYANSNIVKKLNKKEYKKADLTSIDASDPEMQRSVAIASQMFDLGLSSLQEAIDELTSLVSNADDLLSGKALKQDYRSVLNDDENSMVTKIYGDNKSGHQVKKEAHGTHVSGIIAASRSNGKGMDGIANNTKIMAVRVVPDGDEYDKDVALGIRYAVDNGAKVINTSFGKGFSPNKEWVFEAIKYAAKNDVLIVNAAGNDGKNIDIEKVFPNDAPDLKNEISDNFLTIGAMSSNYNKDLLASFSNYGKKNVDIFAPGVQIHSTFPEEDYKKISGTSMAAPSTAGVAALIRSYYPTLTAGQVKKIIMNSGTQIGFEVLLPGSETGEMVKLSDICVSGRIVNAYNALQMADKIINGK